MDIRISALNWFGILIAFVAYFFLGALWFTALFKSAYLRSLGKENDQQQNLSPIYFIGPAICTLVITLSSAVLMNAVHVETYAGTLAFAATVGFGYLFSNTVNIAINPNIPRPLLYGLISGVYHVVGSAMCCIILFAMR